MGFDKPDLGFVVHLGAPASPIAYYQQVGRAGPRHRRTPTCVLLPAIEDRDIWALLRLARASPARSRCGATLAALAEPAGPLSTAALEAQVDLRRTRLETMLKVLDVDGAVRRVRGGWVATGAAMGLRRRPLRAGSPRPRERRAAGDARLPVDRRCRMGFLRRPARRPGGAGGWTCGRCDNCGGLDLPVEVSSKAVAEAADRLARPGVPIEPRKLWPTGLSALGVDRSGRIKQAAEEGRAIARLTDLGHGTALRELFRVSDGEVPSTVPVPLGRGRSWRCLPRSGRPAPDVIVVTESATRSGLVDDLAAGLARYLGLPVVGRWAITDPSVATGQGATNSAQRVAAVTRRHGLVLDDPDGVRGLRVLLVDDLVVTGWSLTLASDALINAGADAVLPLTLGVSA